MNAKKIMGAVLVAFLAAALFIGAGAAAVDAEEVWDGDTVFVYQKIIGLSGEWTNGVNTITAISKDGVGYFSGENIVEGKYTQGSGDDVFTLYVKYPAVTVTGVANQGDAAYLFIGGNLYQGAAPINVETSCPANSTIFQYNLYLTTPNGEEIPVGNQAGNTIVATLGAKPALGEYSILAKYGTTGFAVGTPVTTLITKPVTFKVVGSDEATITASVDQILKGKAFKVTVTGEPGVNYKIGYDFNAFNAPSSIYFSATPTGDEDNGSSFIFEMPNSGSVEFSIAGNTTYAEKTEKLTLYKEVTENSQTKYKKVESVTITFTKGTISAKADAASYFVGDVITISGTNTAGPIVGYTIKGTNFEYTFGNVESETIRYEEGSATSETFEFEIATAGIENEKYNLAGKKLDVGTYTLTIFVGNMGLEENQEPTAKATVALVLKQPFLTIVEAPEVIVQDTDVEFIINAEATEEIAYYIFGTNYFTFKAGIEADDEIENQFTIELGKGITKNMSAGQYFMVIQHPMYDTFFNIMASENAFYLNSTADASNGNGSELFGFDIRQTANAAQALCDNLDSQTIDDMYVKYSFFVVGEDESFTLSEIPTTIAQGETLTISGVSTSNAEDFVTVEMISTAFAAVPKETVGSAAFIAVTTQIAEDGTWEVTLDTSDLNVDEYSLKVACGDSTWKNVNINVVEAADKPDTPDTPDVPDTPDTPDTPTEPETPGFGALAALAGLGAVAVLLLRRE